MSTGEVRLLEFEVVKEGSHAFGRDEPSVELIRSREQWERTWKALESTTVPTPPPLDVDFERQSLVAVFAGEKRSGGHRIAVERLEVGADGKTLDVKVKESGPGPDAVAIQVITSPYQVVSVPAGSYELAEPR